MAEKKKSTKKKKKWQPTVKQERFVDLYILYNGNATKAAYEAGYEGSDATIRALASRLLTNQNVWKLIEQRREQAKIARIINIQRRQEILSDIAENKRAVELKKPVSGCDTVRNKDTGESKYALLDSVNKDVIKSIDTLNKMDGIYVQKHEVVLPEELLNAVLKGLPEEFRDEFRKAVREELAAALSK